MTPSYSRSRSTTFTRVHARYMAAKVATDLKRMQRFYGLPNDDDIERYETELVELLVSGYLSLATYGFYREGGWIAPTVEYTATELSTGAIDDDPGRIPPNADVGRASFYSYVMYTSAWAELTPDEREQFEATLPFRRTTAPRPGVNGYLVQDRTYSSGGRSLLRSSVRSSP